LTGRTARRRVVRVTLPSDGFPGGAGARPDLLVAEEPLGIRVDGSALTVTMHTPGDDVELAAGFLVGDGVVHSHDDIAGIRLCDGTSSGHGGHDGLGNIADVRLALGVEVGSGPAPPPSPGRPLTGPAAPARPGQHRAPSEHEHDWAYAIVPRFRGNIKRNTRQTTSD
jgi:FdhD protein